MQTPTKITFVGFLLFLSSLSVSAAKVNAEIVDESDTSNTIEYRLSRITEAIQQREIETSNHFRDGNPITRGFGNRSGGGGFANRGGGGFVNRGGGGFANRGGGGFANGGGGGFVNRSPFRNGGGFYNRY